MTPLSSLILIKIIYIILYIIIIISTCELLDMDNDVDYNVKLVAIILIFNVNT